MAHQSIAPKTAANRPLTIPTEMSQNDTVEYCELPVARYVTSKPMDVARRPNGNTIKIGCIGCPKNFALLSILRSRLLDVVGCNSVPTMFTPPKRTVFHRK